MKKRLILIPTEREAKALISALNMSQCNKRLYCSNISKLDLLICGIGMPMSIMKTMKQISMTDYASVLIAGTAGAYNTNYKIGDLVCVETEIFADMGAHEKGSFAEFSFLSEWMNDYQNGYIKNEKIYNFDSCKLPHVTSNTVNMVNIHLSGFPVADIENLEGAGLFLLLKSENIPFVEIRAISNYVKDRNKSAWDMNTAIGNLTEFIVRNIEQF
jgi:futalosine hydrolase